MQTSRESAQVRLIFLIGSTERKLTSAPCGDRYFNVHEELLPPNAR